MSITVYNDFCDVEDPRGSWVRGEDFLLVLRALMLCNESRNRLTKFESSLDFWMKEAEAE